MSPRRLDEYAAKRDFARTPEPTGDNRDDRDDRDDRDTAEGVPTDDEHRFAIQEHHARSLHWDLRLERRGALASWAIPKGIPPDPQTNHLAVHTEDHPLDYLTFEGNIPEGEYGAGRMTVWDAGTYETHKWSATKVEITLHGEKARGRYALFQTRDRNWMIHRMDPPEDPDRVPPPERLAPTLATLSRGLPETDGWAYEMKWDGVRALALVRGGRVRLTSRNGNDVTAAYPEVGDLGETLGATEVLLDGELVAIDDEGHASFQRLQRRMHIRDANAARRLMRQVPVVYMVFDVLWLDGRLLTGLPYRERRDVLVDLDLAGPAWQTPAVAVDDGEAALATSARLGFEGVIAKRLDSVYEPGRRSRHWLKLKHQLGQELVIGGWLEGKGKRAGRIGALLLGYYEGGELVYAGRVGTGFSDEELRRLGAALEPLARDDSPFRDRGLPRDAHFVEPDLVAQVRFGGWTREGRIRQSAYLGLRDDKAPHEVVREDAPT